MTTTSAQNTVDCDVAIVGGGMVGLTLALMLSKLDCAADIRVIDPNDFASNVSSDVDSFSPSFDARSTALSSGTIRLFEQLGIWAAMTNQASPIKRVAVSDRGHLGFSEFTSAQNNNRDLGAVIENSAIGEVLARAANAVDKIHLTPKTRVRAMRPVAAAMRLDLQGCEGATALRARLVVLADGALSPLAKKLGIRFSQHGYDQHAIIANVAHSEPHHASAYECFCETGPLAMLPLRDHKGQHRSALVWTRSVVDAESTLAWDDATFIDHLQQQFGYRLGKIRAVGNRHSYPLNLYLASEQVRSNLVLMGNAAHFLHPVAGQGFNLAMRDCAELFDQLRTGSRSGAALGDLGVLQRYAKRRWKDQCLTTELSHSFIQLFASDNVLKAGVRNAGLLALNALPPIKTAFFRQMMGTAGKGVILS